MDFHLGRRRGFTYEAHISTIKTQTRQQTWLSCPIQNKIRTKDPIPSSSRRAKAVDPRLIVVVR